MHADAKQSSILWPNVEGGGYLVPVFHKCKEEPVVAFHQHLGHCSSMSMAYQAQLENKITSNPDSNYWDEICVVNNPCLQLHRSAIQASARSVGITVAQDRTCWPNLLSLFHKEKVQTTVDHKGLFGSAVASMQQKTKGG
ncbi:hypothetical protein AOLI_G00008720 [Acnodon oligacanthus]